MSCPPCCFANVLSPTPSSYLNSQKSDQRLFLFFRKVWRPRSQCWRRHLCAWRQDNLHPGAKYTLFIGMNSICWQSTFEVRYDRHVSKTMSILITQDNNVHFWKRLKVMAWLVCGLLLVVSCGIGGWLATNSSYQTKLNQTQETKPIKSIQT